MGKRSQAVAINALMARIGELKIRLAHAKLAGDADKVDRVEKKLSRAMGQLARLRRKSR